ncbi:HLH transcription factor, putative [Trichophyton verrucosum HKI 0517]|uniref:HLH transcription factor, putative n=1 Tax=Trichophyton verrucosum (strain HKI 0517) TaxID=663202 RepID=D4DGR8_TRIVH|nr:HLH transcription factor, putative [Trichophyton verrucosum HKI 0517]EFE38932.1 HLH transcription factor, putative [Trichophyton verrucosum HKI 0517]
MTETVSPFRRSLFSANPNSNSSHLGSGLACSMELGLSESAHHMKGSSTPPPGPFGCTYPFEVYEGEGEGRHKRINIEETRLTEADALISPQDTPFDSAPERPLGPALLDDSESNMLDNLFTSLNASQFDNNDFWLSFGEQNGAEPGSNFSWPELPPNFEGSATNLPTPQSHHPHPAKQSGTMSTPDRSTALSSDVLAAAQMLYQNGHDNLSALHNQLYAEHGLLNHNSNANYHTNSNIHFQQQQQQQHHHSHQIDAKRAQLGRYNDGSVPQKEFVVIPKGIHTTTMIFDPAAHRSPANDHQQPRMRASASKLGPSMLQWGSDSGFAHQGYRLPPGQPTVEETTENLLHNLECLEAQSSAANTRPSSPVRKLCDRKETASSLAASRNPVPPSYEDRPKKRRKSNNKIKEEDPELASALSSSKSPTTTTPTSSTTNYTSSSSTTATSFARPSSRKSKGSSPAGNGTTIKPVRENLSEEQKRTNHILSEQKRRNLIKQGFDDLCSLVPELRGGGYSKSTMLTQAGDWLADLLAGNELLKAQLADLKARGG